MTKPSFPRHHLSYAALGLVVTLSACGPAAIPPAGEINDPQEAQNRSVHDFNRGLDRALVDPTSEAVGTVLPDPVLAAVSRASSNLSQPGNVVNNVLQLRFGQAIHNSARFVVNTTIGVGGLFDPATQMGLSERDTDFGETLHVWGFPEGAYTELPLLGPSTSRDALGRVVDIALNPLRHVGSGSDRDAITALSVTARLGDRHRYSDTIESILYETEDSYAQLRILYLQNRRFELRGDAEPDYFDPYEDPYEDPYADPIRSE